MKAESVPGSLPQYTPEFLTSIERTISKDRLRRYLNATGQDLPAALVLYEHNIKLSEALYGLLHCLEVTVRNAAHHVLSASYGVANWYDFAPLSAYCKGKVGEAKGAASLSVPGMVISELTFGFWVNLLSRPNHNTLWMGKKLIGAFPNTTVARNGIHQRLKTVQRLRNRISHHELILTTSNTLYAGFDCITLAQFLECMEWVCRDTAHWMKARLRYADASGILSEVAALGLPL